MNTKGLQNKPKCLTLLYFTNMSHNEINLESMNLKRALETLCSSASKQLFAQAEDDLIRTQRAPGKIQPSLFKVEKPM